MLRRLSRKGRSDSKSVLAKFLDFIDTPIWALPIATFIEQRSVVFDRQQGNVALYEEIHKEFSDLVDTLVECFCADSNIPLNQLKEALRNAEAERLSIHQKTNLEPIAAAESFNVFVPMMMRKNVELQLQALQMIEFMCGLIPSVLQIEEGETLKNKPRVVTPEETERYVLIAVMRQSREEFDNLTRNELLELEEVLRSSEEERRRLEAERGKEDELLAKALATSDGNAEKSNQTPSTSTAGAEPPAPSASPSMPARKTSEESAPKPTKEASVTVATAVTESKQPRTATAKKDRRESAVERPPSAKNSVDKDRRQSLGGERSPSARSSTPAQPRNGSDAAAPKKTDGRPPTAKRSNTPASEARASVKSATTKERRPSTEARRRKEEPGADPVPVDKTTPQEPDDDSGLVYGPRGKNIYDVNALLQEPNRLNSATVRSREEYLKMQRDRLLTMKANEREKQMNEVSQRAAQERPRTAKAARGLMRGSRAAIGTDEVLATRKAIVEQLKNEMDAAAPET
ncbi:hypothetical protein Q1695_004584 [Nippostrongylus brasiliensis]|nr:hypothetical protein Q1695_004584 [Nippostrongylus brasiliensis]